MKPLTVVIIIAIIWNVITFFMMGIDKRRAKKDRSRIRERTLLLSGFVMGAVGITLGALLFHHKTKKWKFRICVPLALVVNAVAWVGILVLSGVIG